MTTRRDVNLGILSTIAAATATEAFAQMPHTIELPPPVTEGGKSLMQSLKDRRSIRDYSDRAPSNQIFQTSCGPRGASIGLRATAVRRRVGAAFMPWTFISPWPTAFGFMSRGATGCFFTWPATYGRRRRPASNLLRPRR